jgi:hypothetical protein
MGNRRLMEHAEGIEIGVKKLTNAVKKAERPKSKT